MVRKSSQLGNRRSSRSCLDRWKASVDGIWKALGELLPCSEWASQKLIRTVDMMQQIANDINKMKRS
jgi:hypothetical protein